MPSMIRSFAPGIAFAVVRPPDGRTSLSSAPWMTVAGIVGTVEQAAARLREYEAAGVTRVYLQHLVHRDIAMVELIGRELVPAVAS